MNIWLAVLIAFFTIPTLVGIWIAIKVFKFVKNHRIRRINGKLKLVRYYG